MGRPKINRTNEEKINYQGCLMKIVEYNDANNIIVEFQDDYKSKVHTSYQWFIKGKVQNPYYPSVYDIGITGNKYCLESNYSKTKEYATWTRILQRCFIKTLSNNKNVSYQEATCCEEWLLYENFYEWLHSQPNFDKWLNEDYEIDKDIIIKGNKVYSPKTCCLVPYYINTLFIKRTALRGDCPIGVVKRGKKYVARCKSINKKLIHIGCFSTPEEAFNAYKKYKENIIKQIAEIEYSQDNITKECYEAMMKYEVEITD